MRVLVTGAGGLIGGALVPALAQRGHAVTRLVRRPRAAAGGRAGDAAALAWDLAREPAAPEGLPRGAFEAVVHLAGEPIAQRWTRDARRRIVDSRVRATDTLSRALAALARPPAVLVSASAMGWYGDRGDEQLDEGSAAGSGFLAGVTRDWEHATSPARDAGIRVVNPRFGIVLSPDGGALAPLLPMFRLGLGGPIGSGRTWWSWIALHDVVEVLLRMLLDERLAGPVNVTSPEAVRNAEFARALGHALHRPAWLPVPAFALRLAFGDMARETLLASARVRPARLLAIGHTFRTPALPVALAAVLAR